MGGEKGDGRERKDGEAKGTHSQVCGHKGRIRVDRRWKVKGVEVKWKVNLSSQKYLNKAQFLWIRIWTSRVE